MITYTSDPSTLQESDLTGGFFAGWPSAPSPAQHLAVLRGSHRAWIALDGRQVVGFVNLISDGVLTAFVPWLEVLPGHQGRGIGTELMRRVLDDAKAFYSVDLVCDAELEPFYRRLGLMAIPGMGLRNRAVLAADLAVRDEAPRQS